MVKRNVRKAKRSGTQACPTCGEEVPLVEHHIHGRNVRGWRESWNVLFLCPTCHDLVHLGKIVIVGWFKTSHGRELVWYGEGEEPPDPELFQPANPPRYSDE